MHDENVIGKEIAVTGEGPTDYGTKEFGGEWLWGPVGVYLYKVAEKLNKSINLIPIERKDVESFHLGRSISSLSGKAIPARRFYAKAKADGYSYGIYYSDADKKVGTRNTKLDAERCWKEKYNEVAEGLNNDLKHFIPMIPLRMIESWILADKPALEEVGDSLNFYPDREPEMLWGDEHNPDSNYPKCVLTRVVNRMKKKPKVSGMSLYVEIAENQNVEILIERCPVSFEKFYEDYTGILNSEDMDEFGIK